MKLSISKAILEGAQGLIAAGVAEARRESGSLLAHAIGRDRTFIVTHADQSLEAVAVEAFRKLIERRAAGEPLQYLAGHQEFFKLDFEVTPDVLIPRPETELVVEIALELLQGNLDPFIADIGTGSGCIAISLLHELRDAQAIATDCFAKVDPDRPFSLIASNPPYIRDDEMEMLQREVRHEPRTALAGGPDGLDIVRRLLREALPFLAKDGHFVFEIGFGQNTLVEQLINREIWELIEMRPDLQGIARTVVLRKK